MADAPEAVAGGLSAIPVCLETGQLGKVNVRLFEDGVHATS
ncbi:hypothetical protein BWQ96_03786 [Gracilariopsis chorda]|uniref:Uncharacterized protein n=1 Tax=Gracilariopsis chorda TaxID=448386 RepID=A0A2V3IWH7_9FLOR|nr:hypothetical protein BWQ96_03786 [Gracilariopsis chorda]|eukprot:PXF46461.1 hypothetical protein BWQ96_03786 [Gracilariopsis chorda]